MCGLVVTSSAWDWYQSSIAEHLAHKYKLSASQVKKKIEDSFPCYVKFMFVNTIVCFPREQFCYDEINDSSLKLGNHTVHMDTLHLHVKILYVGIYCLSD